MGNYNIASMLYREENEEGLGGIMSIAEEFLELRDKWSKALNDGDKETYEQLVAKGNKLKEKFTVDDWETLIKNTHNIQAKIHYSKEIEKQKKKNDNEYDERYTYYDIYGLCRELDGKTERYIKGEWKEIPGFDAEKYVKEQFMDDNLEANLTKEQYDMLIY